MTRRNRKHAWGLLAVMALASAPLQQTAPVAAADRSGVRNGTILFEASTLCYDVECFGPANANYDIWAVQPDGSGLTNLTRTPGVDADAAWSPDGDRVIFNSNRDGDYDIYTMAPDGSDVQPLVTGAGWQVYPTWSPNERRIAYIDHSRRSKDIMIARADGSKPRVILSSYADQLFALTWSPDGKWIAFTKVPTGSRSIFVHLIRPDGSGLRRLGPRKYMGEWQAWSPDGRRLVVDGGPCNERRCPWDLWIVRRDGTWLRKLSVGDDDNVPFTGVWSPDGKHIVYSFSRSDDPPLYGDLWIVNADGTDNRILVRKPDTFDYRPAWQPLPQGAP